MNTIPAPLPDNNQHALRLVARSCRKAALATSMDGRPYASLVTVAFDHDLSPILLLSGIADHTRNLEVDPHVALLLEGTQELANPQTGPRVTLTGHAVRDSDPRLRRRFLAVHPGAALYADFADFAVWRVCLERAHFVGGFGRAVWLDAPLVPPEDSAALAQGEEAVLIEMNQDHGARLAALLSGRTGDWRLVGLDVDGCDLAAGEDVVRVAFPLPIDVPGKALSMIAEWQLDSPA